MIKSYVLPLNLRLQLEKLAYKAIKNLTFDFIIQQTGFSEVKLQSCLDSDGK